MERIEWKDVPSWAKIKNRLEGVWANLYGLGVGNGKRRAGKAVTDENRSTQIVKINII